MRDNGVGIEPDYVESIFLPFKRLVNHEVEGSGIGLSICKRIVTLHNGEIWVEESVRGNTLFKFSISKNLKSA